jgi:hypothetical protein
MGFSQHQSFYFRDRWLEKFFDYQSKSNDIKSSFDSSNYFKLGIGKNMFESLKFWVKVFDITNNDYELTEFGKVLKSNDPLLLDNNSLSLLHYKLVTNKKDGPFWFWFFNIFNGSFLNKDDIYLKESLFGWAEATFKKTSINSFKKDLLCFLQMYTAEENRLDPEDSIFSPFSKLKLIKETSLSVVKRHVSYDSIGINALLFSLIEQMRKRKVITLSIEQIIEEEGYWGKVFLLDRVNVIKALNEAKVLYKDVIIFDQTSKLDTITVKENVDIYKFIQSNLGIQK